VERVQGDFMVEHEMRGVELDQDFNLRGEEFVLRVIWSFIITHVMF